MKRFNVSEAAASLGLALYVLGCKFSSGIDAESRLFAGS